MREYVPRNTGTSLCQYYTYVAIKQYCHILNLTDISELGDSGTISMNIIASKTIHVSRPILFLISVFSRHTRTHPLQVT